MKKGVSFLSVLAWLLVCLPAWPLDWSLPVTTLRYEVAAGDREDPDDESMQPASVRHTATLRIKEDADPDSFGLTVRGSLKDYFLQSGDYAYVEVEQDGTLRLADAVKLGYTVGAKDLVYPQTDADGLSKDSLAVNTGTTLTLTIARGASLDAGLSGRWEMADNPARSLSGYVASLGLSARLGEWVFGARYRGEFRLPRGALSAVVRSMYHTGSISASWDPNR